ncbi:MAG: hypothetical protein ABL984_02905 [Pyrinomonadaceae bacterium]
MAPQIPGIGRKRPQLNIPISLVDLDARNPRLASPDDKPSQIELTRILYEEFDLEELAYSMSENGYFDEEPIVVIPTSTPKAFKLPSQVRAQEEYLQKLIEQKAIRFTVVEGNRRAATLKLLTDVDLRKRLKINIRNFPVPTSKAVLDDLRIVPGIFYPDRTGISAYLGVRHIAGLLKWEAYAKAVFLAQRIEQGVEEGKSIDDSIKETQRQTADRTDVIRKQYLYLRVLREAEEDLGFDTRDVRERFSLIAVALNSPSVRAFVGIDSYKSVDFSKRVVPRKQLPNLELLLTWIYGNGKDKLPILTDSRRITSRLAPVLDDENALAYLKKYENLEDAYERSGGERTFLLKKISGATKSIESALSFVYKYDDDDDVRTAVHECANAAEQLKQSVS